MTRVKRGLRERASLVYLILFSLVAAAIPLRPLFGRMADPRSAIIVHPWRSLSVCWVISLHRKFIQECLYSVWSMARYVEQPYFNVSLYLFVWPGPDAVVADLNNSQAVRHLRQIHPSVPIRVCEFERAWIPAISEEIFPTKFPIMVASRVALPLVLDSDFVMYLDTDTHVLQNPFGPLKREFRTLTDALLMGVHDTAAGPDPAFVNPMKEYHICWELYQQAALYIFRNGPKLRNTLQLFFVEWSKHKEVFRFPEQDAVAMYFPLSLKGMLPDAFLRQWADCNIAKGTTKKIICHGRGDDMDAVRKIASAEMEAAGISHISEDCCFGL
jgi:hypothetical protein